MHRIQTGRSFIPAFFMHLLLVLASATFSVNALANTQIVTPTDGSTLSGTAQTFTWTIDSADIESFWLYVGTTVGGLDIANSGDLGTDTQYDVIGIPVDGTPVHARLWYYSASRWSFVDSMYTAANDVDVSPPTMDSPANDSELPGSSVDFAWSHNNTPVNYWWLYLGTTQGGFNLYNSGTAIQNQTSVTVDGLPTDGNLIYARLWFRTTANGWEYVDSMYRAAVNNPEPPTPTSVSCSASPNEIQQSTLNLINSVRSQGRMCGSTFYESVPPVVWDNELEAASLGHSNDMSQVNFFSHTGSDGSNPGQRATNQGYIWRTYGENIAAGQQSTAEVIDAWTNSPGHCANLMNPNFQDVAVACAESNSSQYGRYWTNMFGTRR